MTHVAIQKRLTAGRCCDCLAPTRYTCPDNDAFWCLACARKRGLGTTAPERPHHHQARRRRLFRGVVVVSYVPKSDVAFGERFWFHERDGWLFPRDYRAFREKCDFNRRRGWYEYRPPLPQQHQERLAQP